MLQDVTGPNGPYVSLLSGVTGSRDFDWHVNMTTQAGSRDQVFQQQLHTAALPTEAFYF